MTDQYLEQLQTIQSTLTTNKRAAHHPIYDYISIRILQFRKAANLSQLELAEKVGLTRTSIVNMEAGRQRMPIHTLVNIAEALGRNITDFFPDDKNALTYAPTELSILQLPNGAKILELLKTEEVEQ
jgi:transcriptional regulator with XRE-family HTH domain